MKKVLIIGGGVAGLTTGILLTKRGFHCEIYEKNHMAGGNLTGWDRNGYHIDNCIHWLTGTRPDNALYRLWEEVGALGGHIDVHQQEALFSSESENERVSFYRNTDRARREMCRLSPADVTEIERFFRAVDAAASVTVNGGRIRERIMEMEGIMRYLPTSLYRLSASFRHPLLSAAFTDYIGGEYSALGLVLAYAAFASGNGGIPAGGSRAMAERMANRFLDYGGYLYTDSPVAGIMTDGDRATGIRLADGETVAGDYIVAACDSAVTFGRLLPTASMPRRLLSQYERRRAFPVFSAFQTAIAVDGTELPFRGTAGFPILPLLSDGRCISRLTVREFSHEPGFMPEGKGLLQCMIYQHTETARTFMRLRAEDPERYRLRKEELAHAIVDRIEKHYPMLAGKLRVIDAWTPATYNRYFDSFYGAFMSFAVTGKALPLAVPQTPRGYRNIYLAGQWYRPPGGLPSAALSGKSAAKKIIADSLVRHR